MTNPLHKAELEWTETGLPRSRRYGDVYFSDQGGLDEARHVFLEGNHLTRRMAEAPLFTVGETGFGSGLNFLALWQLWERVAPPHAHLRFFSVEKHPLAAEDMARIHALFPELTQYGQQLVSALPLPVPGFHRFYLAQGRIQVTLMYGDALEQLRQQDAQADAWFLDGFAPRLNPELWSKELAHEMRRLSAPGATMATFSTSATTCEALAEAGFALEKKPGFGRKKYMLCGHSNGINNARYPALQTHVVGAGLAGAATAHALARRGAEVTVYETAARPAAGASANPSAIFYPGVTVGWQPLSQLYYMGFSHSIGLLREIAAHTSLRHDLCGMLLFPKPGEAPERQGKIMAGMQPEPELFRAVNAAEASQLAGVALPLGGLYFPKSGWVNLYDLVHSLLNHSQATQHYNRPVAALPRDGLTILCNGWQAAALHPALDGIMHPVGGQVSCIAPPSDLMPLRCVLSYGGYLTPAIDGAQHMGATYEKHPAHAEVTAEGHLRNADKLNQFFGRQMIQSNAAQGGWGGMRSVSRNRLPLVGALEEGVYANLAHASRGLLSCALSAEYLVSDIYGDPLPLPRNIGALLDPLRFGTG